MTPPDKSSIYRERYALTLEHRAVDRCPMDLGGTPQTTVETQEGIRKLAEHLGLSGSAPSHYDKFDERILDHLDIDFRRAGTMVAFDTGRERRISETEKTNFLGIRFRWSGQYWDIVGGPLEGATKDDAAAFEFPRVDQIVPGLLDDCAERARWLHEETPYVVVGEHPVYGVLELACWLCGYDHIMLMMGLDPEFIHLLFGRILEFQKSVIREYYGRLGRFIHMTTSGDDFGTQQGLFMSPQMWREFVKPYMKERIDCTAQFTDAPYMHHTCGAVFDVIPDLVEIGVRALNPIQPNAKGMEPERLKDAFGADIVFHGGLDTQQVLPSGDFDAIDAAVEHLLSVMKPEQSGGFVFAAAHNIQDDVSPAAVERMLNAVRQAFDSG